MFVNSSIKACISIHFSKLDLSLRCYTHASVKIRKTENGENSVAQPCEYSVQYLVIIISVDQILSSQLSNCIQCTEFYLK